MANHNEDNNIPIISIGHIEMNDEATGKYAQDMNDLPILPTRNLVLFPGVAIPIRIGRENSLKVAMLAQDKGLAIGVVCQKDPDDDSPSLSGLFRYGVLADVIKVLPLPDGSHTAIVKARNKIRILGRGNNFLMPEADICASFKIIDDQLPKRDDKEFYKILIPDIKKIHKDFIANIQQGGGDLEMPVNFPEEAVAPEELINLIATHAPFDIEDKMEMLKVFRIKDRASLLLVNLIKQNAKAELTRSLHEKARESFDEQQRRTFLQRQMEVIDRELNGEDSDIEIFRQRAQEAGLPEEIAKTFAKELDKLARYNPQSPDYSVQYTYLETILDLPWNKKTELKNNFSDAKDILEADHYGLKKVKDRILEQLAMIMHNPGETAPIICLVGPPGVGKTSLGSSIAKALNRKYGRISLGGVHDEAEIRGHRRTYIGAMPGRIIDAIKRAGTNNPLLVLDEIDKLGKDYKGDPSSALLEVLDPEQNSRFHDNYVDLDFDLSSVMFIATANDLSNVPGPLLDRMEIIQLSGYLPEEKKEIARRHLLPQRLKRMNINEEDIHFSDEAIMKIIANYTSESGVRQLDKELSSVLRKLLKNKMETGSYPKGPLNAADIVKMLGPEYYDNDKYEGNDFAGVVTGLAWTASGGDILFIEASLSPGSGKLSMTGSLGDVMKESATIAYQYVKSHAAELNINYDLIKKYDVHIHFPAGSIPKDGPSAGITIVTALVSAFRQTKVAKGIAMTGEITLRGKVLAVGGIREKLLAARRAGIFDIILPNDCKKNVEEIEPQLIEGMTLHFVSKISEVLALAITDIPAVDAISL